jgi:hypothetical protein
MSDQSSGMNTEVTDTQASAESQETAVKTYSQEEFDRHMAGLKNSLAKKYERQYSELGDIDDLRQLKTEAEQRRQEEQLKRGEFEKTLQELAAKKDAEISKRDTVIKEYKVNTPLLSAAAKYNAVNAEQVKSLLSTNVRLSGDGEVEVVDGKGSVRYNDRGEPIGVDDLVKEFLDTNPHFKLANPSTTNTRNSIANRGAKELDITKLDMSNPEDRTKYKEWKKSQGLR